ASDSGERARFTVETVDEMEPVVAPRPRVGDERQRRGLRLVHLLGVDRAVLLHASEHVGETFLGAFAMAVGTVIVWPLGQTGEQRTLGQRQLLRRLAEIGARRHLDAPGAAAEVDRVEIEFENFRLAELTLDARGDDDLA